MNKNADDAELITAYLLRTLPEEDSERFDELSVSDDEFVDALRVVENDLIDSYVRGNLTGTRLEQFKAAYLSAATGRQKINFAHVLLRYGEKNPAPLIEKLRVETSVNPEPRMKGYSFLPSWEIFRIPRLARLGFATAVLVFLIVGGWLVLENIRLRRQLSQEKANNAASAQRSQEAQRELELQRENNSTAQQELASKGNVREGEQQIENKRPSVPLSAPSVAPHNVSIASFLLTPQMRGPGEIQRISLPPSTSVVAIKLQLEPNHYSSYQVVLMNESKRSLWRSNTIELRKESDNKSLSIRLPAELLKQETYVLQVYGVAGRESEVLGDYPFKVVKQ